MFVFAKLDTIIVNKERKKVIKLFKLIDNNTGNNNKVLLHIKIMQKRKERKKNFYENA